MVIAAKTIGIIFVCAHDDDDDDEHQYCTLSLEVKNTPNVEEEASVIQTPAVDHHHACNHIISRFSSLRTTQNSGGKEC